MLLSNPEKERERGRGREGGRERERSPYMGTQADNVWQWLRGQQRSDTRQMEEIKHGTEQVLGPENSSCSSARLHKAWPGFLFFFA